MVLRWAPLYNSNTCTSNLCHYIYNVYSLSIFPVLVILVSSLSTQMLVYGRIGG